MKNTIKLIVFCLFVSYTSFSQQWLTNLEDAQQIASKEKKPILLVFQGSDWCAPCIKLSKNIWSSEVFKNYAKDHYVLVRIDFPRKKRNTLEKEQLKLNQQVAEKYNKNGIFPLVVVLNYEGEILGQTGYKKISPQNYINEINEFIN